MIKTTMTDYLKMFKVSNGFFISLAFLPSDRSILHSILNQGEIISKFFWPVWIFDFATVTGQVWPYGVLKGCYYKGRNTVR